YNHFFVTFPVSFVSELTMVFLSLAFVQHSGLEYVLQACFLLYVPIGYYTFKHLLHRRDEKYTQYLIKRAQGRANGVDLDGQGSAGSAESSATLH
ncbi:hypothetical protein OXX59_009474, partial [Metschnikowia pulcherrima]